MCAGGLRIDEKLAHILLRTFGGKQTASKTGNPATCCQGTRLTWAPHAGDSCKLTTSVLQLCAELYRKAQKEIPIQFALSMHRRACHAKQRRCQSAKRVRRLNREVYARHARQLRRQSVQTRLGVLQRGTKCRAGHAKRS